MSETHCYLKVPSSSSSDTWRRPAGHGGVVCVCVCVCMCVWLWVSGELCVCICVLMNNLLGKMDHKFGDMGR